MQHYKVAIIGSGPAGLSAAARAQFHDQAETPAHPSYILLEGYAHPSKTIQQYQKGKHVMAEPGFLDLRSDVEFLAGTREAILSEWVSSIDSQSINIRYQSEVLNVEKQGDNFHLSLVAGDELTADKVILAIGIAGNPRKLGAPGENIERVLYQLDDPGEFSRETIVVVGAGDAAIENALGLATQNSVYIVNRRDEFSRAKDGNLNAVLAAISNPGMDFNCFYSTTIVAVNETPDAEMPLEIILQTAEGEQTVPCHRVLARLGGIPPRAFVEKIGIEFPNAKPDAVPELSSTYETNVPGAYIIGALAGFPLIKQAMNQGYDVIEFIRGNNIKPADYPLLEYQFHVMPFEREPDDLLELFQNRIPMFRELNALGFRELIFESSIMVSYPEGTLFVEAEQKLAQLRQILSNKDPIPRFASLIKEGDYLYRQGDYATSLFTVVEGEVTLSSPQGEFADRSLTRGQFFGESSLISGQPRIENAVAGANCILVETPRRTMVKLMNSNEEVRAGIDLVFVIRELQRTFAPEADYSDLRKIAGITNIRQHKAGSTIYQEGEQGASMHLVRNGSVSLSRLTSARGKQKPLLVAELRSGELVGQMALMGDPVRRETVIASVATETIEIERPQFLELIEKGGAQMEGLQQRVSAQALSMAQMEVRPESGDAMQFLMTEGIGESTNTLIIDENLCIGCDNCEKACAETHAGISRLDRSAGRTFANIHLPVSCRHCEHPHCMKDCPPNAIHRRLDGEVFIDDACIGCGNCEANCPYDVIKMSYPAPKKPGLYSWMLFGKGSGPGEQPGYEPAKADKESGKRATKCDACMDRNGSFACVDACPTGAAQRLSPDDFITLVG
ncbi:MAG: cyclic nucleotide-binding domain-containing protein [Pseudomonadales bacterium]|nr:cyclic nucleotide-binding domain-containing protein [Pseudomonadales bacterium]